MAGDTPSFEIEVGEGLLALVDPKRGGELPDGVAQIRDLIQKEKGVAIPAFRIRDNSALGNPVYRILKNGAEIARGELMPERLLAVAPRDAKGEIAGEKTTEPAFGVPALWIAPTDGDRARELGYTVAEATSVLATHLLEVVRREV